MENEKLKGFRCGSFWVTLEINSLNQAPIVISFEWTFEFEVIEPKEGKN